MEDTKLEEIMDEEEALANSQSEQVIEKIDYSAQFAPPTTQLQSLQIFSPQPDSIQGQQERLEKQRIAGGAQQEGEQKTLIRALNGEVVDDEFLADALNYEFLMEKIDLLLEKLKLDA
jgi:hypothetical protein